MKRLFIEVNYLNKIRLKVYLLALLVPSVNVLAQIPQVRLIDRPSASPSQIVSLTGSNFGTDPTKLAVFFGGAKGTISSVSDQLLEVQTPNGTTFDKISVFNTTTGLGSSSRGPFFLDYGGSHPIDVSKLKPQVDIAADQGLYDHCLCDFDGDAKLDVATANQGSSSGTGPFFVTLLKNNSTSGSFSFTKSSVSVPTGTIHARCGDLNGDGLPDLVISENKGGSHIYIFRNTGGFSFNLSTINISGKKVKQLEIADLDADGKSELIVTDQGAADIIILPNQSTTSTISFGAPVITPISGITTTDGISITDLNGDYRPEIIVSQFLTTISNVVILHNQSTVGNFSFADQKTLSIAGSVVNLKIGDLDGDRLPEIIATQLLNVSLSVFLNTSSSSIQFAPAQTFATDVQPWGLDLGDLDGDGKLDIVVASVTNKSLTILNNSSTLGSLSFLETIIPTTFINRHVKIADMDGDGKPDITFTSIDDTNNNIPASKISIIRNASCMTPEVLPGGPLTICTGFPLRLNGTVNGGVAYQWYNNGVLMATQTNSYLDVTVSGKYTVTATGEGGTCTTGSNEVDVTVSAAPALSVAVPVNNGPVCLNGTLQLSVVDVGASQYLWNGPGSYTGSGLTPAPVSNFAYTNAGRYYLDVYSGTCIAQRSSTVVESVVFPQFTVSSSSPTSGLICSGSEVLTLVPSASNVSYQWYEKTAGLLAGQTSSSLNASVNGSYYGAVTSTIYAGCQPAISDTVDIKFVGLPVPEFTAATTACVGQVVSFTDQSTFDPQATPVYSWDFGDASTVSTDQNPTHSFPSANTFTVKLTVSYTGNVCAQSQTHSISVVTAPSLSITSSTGVFSICQGSTITLQAAGTGFDPTTYVWSNAATTPTINVNTDGNFSVSAKTTATGCLITANQVITLLPLPIISISANPTLVNAGQPSQLTASGLTSYVWHPGKTLSDSTIADPSALPTINTLYIVTGTGSNGCIGKDSITVNVRGESVTGKLGPKNFFSPGNGDLLNEKWLVDNITDYPQCGVSIYDEKGIKVFEAKPYLNDWDGTFNGKPLPIGAYYYIIRCDGDSTPKTGSITIVR